MRPITLSGAPHSEQADLILMPTHGHGPFRRLLLGSVTSKVLHDAECPVWTGVHENKDRPAEPMTLKHVVCAVDLQSAQQQHTQVGKFAGQ